MTRRRTAVAAILAAGALSGCGAFGGGAGGPAIAPERLGCEYREMVSRARELREDLGDRDRLFTPRPGWNACALLAHNGPPSRASREGEAGGEGRGLLHWWYDGAPGEGLAVLARTGCAGRCDRNESPWTVIFVRW